MKSGKGPHICWFDIPANDIEGVKRFYTGVFDWEIKPEESSSEECSSADYQMISRKNDEDGKDHFIGGILKKMYPSHTMTVYFDVPSVDEYSAKVKKMGGEIVRAKQEIPGCGFFTVCKDPEGNIFALWEEKK